MLRDLTIHNYRVFKDFAIDGLARVNLLVGANNAGKTSFLEAVYLLVNQGDAASLLELLHQRGEYDERSNEPRRSGSHLAYPLGHLFHGHLAPPFLSPVVVPTFGPTMLGELSIQGRQDQPQSLRLQLQTNQQMSRSAADLTGDDRWLPYDLASVYSADSQEARPGTTLRADDDYSTPAPLRAPRRMSSPHRFITTGSTDLAYLFTLWESVALRPDKEDVVVEALRILQPELADIRFTGRQTAGGVLIGLREQENRIPLSSMGAGMHRILTLTMSAVTAEGGVLLVDEIDTGLYHGALTDMWRLLIETARRLDVQIFATTHSWDCVQAFQEALGRSAEESLGRLFRLQRRGDDIREVKYSNKELAIAVREAIEVR